MGFASAESAPSGIQAEYTFSANYNDMDAIMYKAGDTTTLSYIMCTGGIYNSAKQISLNVPVAKSMIRISTITLTEMKAIITGVNGTVNGSSLTYDWLADSNFALNSTSPWKASNNMIGMTFNLTNALTNAVNGTPVTIYASSIKFTFS